MKRAIIIIFCATVFSACKHLAEKFSFDPSKVTESCTYSYEFKADKLMSVTEKTIIHFQGLFADTVITKISYHYTTSGLLSRIDTYYDKNPESEIFEYFPNDSLAKKYSISSEGDTTLWEKYGYFNDGRKTIYKKEISQHIAPEMNLKDIFEHKTYDTTISRNEYAYNGKLCKSMTTYDISNNVVKVIEFQYQNSKIIKESYFAINNNIKVIEKTIYYDYKKSDNNPDYFSLDAQKDTTEYLINTFENNNLALQIEIDDYGNKAFKRFFEKGKKTGEIATGKNMSYRILDSYTYYPDGNKKERLTYKEKLNAR